MSETAPVRQRSPKGFAGTVERGLLVATPAAYYKTKAEKKEPIAPVRLVIMGFLFEIAATMVALPSCFGSSTASPTKR